MNENKHDWVETGTRKSWCRKCNRDASWDVDKLQWHPAEDVWYCYRPEDATFWGYYPSAARLQTSGDGLVWLDGTEVEELDIDD